MLQIILLSSTLVAADDSGVPSIKHCNKYSSKDEYMHSVSKDLAEELGRRLNTSIVHVIAPIKRCAEMLKAGEVNFMFAVKMTDLRADFFDYVIPSNNHTQVIFLIRKSDGNWLRDYPDLENNKLGVVSGYKHFEKLDTDSEINKMRVMNGEQLPKILLGGRVDSIITYAGMANIIMLDHPDIVKALYNVEYMKTSFLASSKQSQLHLQQEELTQTVQGMIDDGFIGSITDENMPGISLMFPKSSNLKIDNIVY